MNLRDFFSPRPERTHPLGLVKFRSPIFENGEWKYLSVKEHPLYSEEQYSPEFYKKHADFIEAVAKRIDPTDYSPMEKMAKVMGKIRRLLHERVSAVLAGYQRCDQGGCGEGSTLWEIHNTLNRDEMIILLMDHLSRIIESTHLNKETVKEMMESVSIQISENRSITFYDVYRNCSWLSPHPKDSIEARWGLRKCEMILSRMQSAQNSISSIERTYRKRDPTYADFAIRQQEEILRRLKEEGFWVRGVDLKHPEFSASPADEFLILS